MGMLLPGIVLLTAAFLLLRVAKPQPDGSPARFLTRESLTTCYALLVTALVGLGASLTVGGAGRMVGVAVALTH